MRMELLFNCLDLLSQSTSAFKTFEHILSAWEGAKDFVVVLLSQRVFRTW